MMIIIMVMYVCTNVRYQTHLKVGLLLVNVKCSSHAREPEFLNEGGSKLGSCISRSPWCHHSALLCLLLFHIVFGYRFCSNVAPFGPPFGEQKRTFSECFWPSRRERRPKCFLFRNGLLLERSDLENHGFTMVKPTCLQKSCFRSQTPSGIAFRQTQRKMK